MYANGAVLGMLAASKRLKMETAEHGIEFERPKIMLSYTLFRVIGFVTWNVRPPTSEATPVQSQTEMKETCHCNQLFTAKAFARDQHFPRVVMAAPVPGTCIRVLLRPETKGEGVWADVIRREKGTPHDVFFCETVESPLRKFRFCPEDVEKGQDEKVFKWSDAKEPKEKIEFMQSEIERMQKELVGGQLWLLDETVKKVPGYITERSQLRLKATILDEGFVRSGRHSEGDRKVDGKKCCR